jgi:hypothetical protein
MKWKRRMKADYDMRVLLVGDDARSKPTPKAD